MNQTYLQIFKKILGIRNRFWRKKWEILKPQIDDLYFYSLKKNYLPFRISFSKTITKLKIYPFYRTEKQIENLYNKNFVICINSLKDHSFILNQNQKARDVLIKNRVLIHIVNPDGSQDPIKTKKINEINDAIIKFLKENYEFLLNAPHKDLNEIFLEIIKQKISRFFIYEDFNIMQEFINSPIGNFFNKLVPGLNLLLEIEKIRKSLSSDDRDLLKIGSHIIIQKVKELSLNFIYILTKNFSQYGKFITPTLAITTSIAFERYESYKKGIEILDNNFQKLIILKKEIDSKKEQEKKETQSIFNQSEEGFKKLLDK